MNKKITFFIISVLFLSVAVCTAEKTPIENLYQYKLDNGLELFVMENHAAPLAYIEIAVKAGGIAQTKENAGLFHLYEHMMFKGNTLYRDAASVQRAINDLGVSEWNGSTSDEYVNYYFTVPSDRLYTGLEFWSYAVREPLLRPDEIENEKKVVLAEVEGELANQNTIMVNTVYRTLFPDMPWKLDPSGAGNTVRSATAGDLKKIQQTYYIPNNTALFVGGDVIPDEVLAAVQKLYGDWKRGDDPWKNKIVQQNPEPFDKVELRVMPFDQCSPEMAQIDVRYRGPDTAFDCESTYAADVFGFLSENPDGFYKQTLVSDKRLCIPNQEYLWESYPTKRASGMIQFGAVVVNPQDNLADRGIYFANKIDQDIAQKILADKSVFTSQEFAQVKQTALDNRILDTETAQGFLSSLRFWWIVADADYYYTYAKKLSSVGYKQIAAFVKKYIAGKYPLVTVIVNPQVYEAQKDSFAAAGYKVIDAQDAYWWNDAATEEKK